MQQNFPVQLDGINLQKGFERFGCNMDSFLQVLRSYVVNTPPLLEAVRAVREDTLSDYAITVHGIKGSSLGICAEQLGAKAEALEKASKAGDLDFVKNNNPAFHEAAEKLIAGLSEMLDKMAAENPKPKKPRPDGDTLFKLASACDSYDIDEIDSAMFELEAYEYESNVDLIFWLRENVDLMNLAEIKEKISSIK
jgi:HPt (histidine-containing phosphotransfer) domain-containing protein